MIPDTHGRPRPSMGTEPYWARLVAIQRVPRLYAPLRDSIQAALDLRITRGDKVLDSSQIGAEVLKGLPPGWFGDFHREFRDFENGAEGSITGMEIYRQLAERPNDRWEVLTKSDPRGVWDTMLYARL